MVKKKSTTNLKKHNDQCFQYAITVALKYQNIKNNLDRISKIKPFRDQYDWKVFHHPKKTGKSLN